MKSTRNVTALLLTGVLLAPGVAIAADMEQWNGLDPHTGDRIELQTNNLSESFSADGFLPLSIINDLGDLLKRAGKEVLNPVPEGSGPDPRAAFGPHEERATPGYVFVASVDLDGDAVADEADNCIYVFNPEQLDRAGDGIGDACAPFPMAISE